MNTDITEKQEERQKQNEIKDLITVRNMTGPTNKL
jgi:hypothetical protein